jgi:predicted dehydrogenase
MHVPVLADAGAQIPQWWSDADASGGWLAAHGSQLIDQIRTTLGEFDRVSASVVHVIDRPMTADDGFVIHFRMKNGCVGTLQSTASDHAIMVETRVTGSTATAWIEGVGATVKVASASGVRTLPAIEDMPTVPAPALPAGSVTTTYEKMITFGVEYGPYVRLAATFRDLILARPPHGPRPATFADGVAMMTVLDAIRRSVSDGGAWTEVEAAVESP